MNFRTFGDIESCKMEVDPATGGSLGICSIIYRDNKSERVLGHQAARAAVNKGSALKIAMQKIHVTLDRDGLKCAKVVSGILQRNQKKQDEVRRKEDEEAARRRPPPSGPRSGDAPERSATLPIRPDGHRISDLDARFVKPRSPGHKAIDDLGTRPAIFVSGRDIPPELKYCKHLYGRLRNFGVDDVLYDRSGFFVVFQDAYGMERCFNICDREPLFNFTMSMKMFPHGNPEHKKVKEAAEKARRDRKRKVKKLEPIDPVKETTASLIRDLKLALMSDVRKRIADVLIYDMLSPEKLKERVKKEEESAPTEPSAVKIETGMDSPAQLDSPMSGVPPLPIAKPSISSLPRFKKRPIKRAVTPISDVPHPRSKRLRDDARPLAHRLNNYDLDGSDEDASDRAVSRAMSTDMGEDDSSATPDAPHRKRKRSFGGHTPSRLRDGNMSSDEEDEERAKGGDDGQTDLDKEMAEFIVDESDEEDAGQKKLPDYQRRAEDAIFTPSASEDEHEGRRKRMKSLDEDGDDVDVMGGLDIGTVMTDGYTKPEGEEAPIPTPTELDDEPPPLDGMPVDLSWTMPTTDFPRPVVEDDDDIILDLDGIQNLCKDEEDFRFLRKALETEQKENIGNPHAFAFRLKEIKAANRDGKRGKPGARCGYSTRLTLSGIIHEPEKIEGFYRPNPSGCARTEGYRRIPEAEKSMYLPHRLAVAAKRANIQTQTPSSTATNNGTTAAATSNKPVSSSRMNRVNNRRLVAELNNQKQILSGDADVMRFNQLKKRKKPVKFARSAIHNWGLYAMENISANDMIIEYVGEIVRQQVADLRERYYLKSGIGSSYLFRIDENTVIDATKRGGIARFINHSCTPNCTAKIIKVEGSKRIVIYALRDIKESKQLPSLPRPTNNANITPRRGTDLRLQVRARAGQRRTNTLSVWFLRLQGLPQLNPYSLISFFPSLKSLELDIPWAFRWVVARELLFCVSIIGCFGRTVLHAMMKKCRVLGWCLFVTSCGYYSFKICVFFFFKPLRWECILF